MRFDFIDAGKAMLLAIVCFGVCLGLVELLSYLENKYKKRIMDALKRKGWKK